jgi:hemerythrin-like domain-containing protein
VASSPGRLIALGNQLVEIHIRLREDLDRLREDLDVYLAGGDRRPRDLTTHCVAFCSALTGHHTGEDGGAFVVLADQHPDLRPVIEQLERDHVLVTEMLRKVVDLIGGLAAADRTAAERIRGELDGLAVLLESHFTYEERKLTTALNALDPRVGTAHDLLGWPDHAR